MIGVIGDLSHVIQLSVAPVFLLLSVGTILSVLSTRLGRIVDRMRVLHDRMETAPPHRHEALRGELESLVRRRNLVNTAVTFGTLTALLICVLITAAFVSYLAEVSIGVIVAVLFILTMLSFIVTLVWFLREVLLAARAVRVDADGGPGT